MIKRICVENINNIRPIPVYVVYINVDYIDVDVINDIFIGGLSGIDIFQRLHAARGMPVMRGFRGRDGFDDLGYEVFMMDLWCYDIFYDVFLIHDDVICDVFLMLWSILWWGYDVICDIMMGLWCDLWYCDRIYWVCSEVFLVELHRKISTVYLYVFYDIMIHFVILWCDLWYFWCSRIIYASMNQKMRKMSQKKIIISMT